jgi:hypothetical protein
MIYVKLINVFTLIHGKDSNVLGIEETTIHIIPTNVKGLILLRYSFLKQLPPTLDDLLANAKQGESTLPGGWGGSLLALS